MIYQLYFRKPSLITAARPDVFGLVCVCCGGRVRIRLAE